MSKKGWGKFIVGASIGAGLGLLFAPKKGSETRRDLRNKFDELMAKVKEIDIEEVREDIEVKIDEIKEELKTLDKEKVLSIAKAKGQDIKKRADELVELAVKKGTPVVKKAAEDVRCKTIDVLKDIITRLEKEEKENKKISKK